MEIPVADHSHWNFRAVVVRTLGSRNEFDSKDHINFKPLDEQVWRFTSITLSNIQRNSIDNPI
jgi:hypothetical protein